MAFVSTASSFVPVQTKLAADFSASDELAAATRTICGESGAAGGNRGGGDGARVQRKHLAVGDEASSERVVWHVLDGGAVCGSHRASGSGHLAEREKDRLHAYRPEMPSVYSD